MDSMFDDDYFLQEEILFPEYGGVTGTVVAACPFCGASQEVAVGSDGSCQRHVCRQCRQAFRLLSPDEQ